MKKHLTILTFVFIALALTACSDEQTNALATDEQSESSAVVSPLPSMAELSERLDLSESQVAELETAFQNLHEAMAARHGGDASKADSYPMLDFIEVASSILTPEQFVAMASVADEHHEKIAAMHRAEKRGMHRQHGQQRRAAGPPSDADWQERMEAHHARRMQTMTTVLELSDAQRTALEEVFASQRALHRQVTASGERPDKERMQAHHEALLQAIDEILSDEQSARFEALQSFGWGMRRGHR